MNGTIREQLADALVKQCLVQIHRNPKDWGRFQVGYVDAIDGESVRIRSVSDRGRVLGFEVYALEAVTGVVLDDGANDYLDKLSRLVRGRRDMYRKVSSWRQSGIRGALEEAMRRQRIVSIGRAHDEEESPCGIVRAMTDDAVSVQLVDQYGEDDGLATIPIEGINAVHFGTEDEQVLDFLRGSYADDDEAAA